MDITTQSARNVLAVPVNVLLALAGGGYGVEVIEPSGQHRLVAVQTGIFDSSRVEVSGQGLVGGDDRRGAGVVMPPVLELEEVVKRYPGEPPVEALGGVSLTIREGELVAIVGQSGSGKTTLVHVIGTLERPTERVVRVAG